MRTEVLSGSIKEYQGRTDYVVDGQPVRFPIEYSVKVELFSTPQEAKDAGEWFTDDAAILKVINAKRKTAAKAGEYQKQTAALKAAYEDTVEYKRDQFVKSAMLAPDMTLEKANGIADSIFGPAK